MPSEGRLCQRRSQCVTAMSGGKMEIEVVYIPDTALDLSPMGKLQIAEWLAEEI